jgi:hypothetical protein
MYGFSESHFIRACGVYNAGTVETREDVLSLAEKTAEKMCSS